MKDGRTLVVDVTVNLFMTMVAEQGFTWTQFDMITAYLNALPQGRKICIVQTNWLPERKQGKPPIESILRIKTIWVALEPPVRRSSKSQRNDPSLNQSCPLLVTEYDGQNPNVRPMAWN